MKVRYNFQNSAPVACCLKQKWNHLQPIVYTQHLFYKHHLCFCFNPVIFISPSKMDQWHSEAEEKLRKHDLAEAGASLLLYKMRGFITQS